MQLIKRTNIKRVVMLATTMLGFTAVSLSGCGSPTNTQTGSIGTYGSDSEGVHGAPTLGVIVDRDGRVIDFEAGSTAQQAGVKLGDVLVAIDDLQLGPISAPAHNGRAIQSIPENIDALRGKVNPGKPLKIRLRRDTKELILNVTPGPRRGQPDQPTPTAVPNDQFYI
jgi:S1-C subfamily serine protease